MNGLCHALGKKIDEIEGGTEYLIEKSLTGKTISSDVIFLLSYTSDFDKMHSLIERREEFNLDEYKIKDLFKGLARSPKHKQFVEEILLDEKKLEEYGILGAYEIEEIACALKDSAFVEKLLHETDFIGVDVDHTGDSSSGKLLLKSEQVAKMIASTGDTEYIKRYATDPELKSKMGFSWEEIALLAAASKDKKLIRTIIEKVTPSREKMIDLITSLNDPEITRDAMTSPVRYGLIINDAYELAFQSGMKREELEDIPTFSDSEKSKLALALITGDDGFLDRNIPEADAEIDLPEDMTIGVEIESVGPLGKLIRLKGRIDDWPAKEDGSVRDPEGTDEGVEVVSPVLSGDNKKTTQKIKKIAGVLDATGQYANSSCGGHVHIGANYLTSEQAINNLYELWANNEKILYTISNKEGEIPRSGIRAYASPISKDLETALTRAEEDPDTVQIDTPKDLEAFKKGIAKKQNVRYKGINFKNLGEGGKGTIEFRLSNGTVDAKTWIENINLYGGLIRAAQEISLIQAKDPSERTEEENEKLALFDTLGTDETLQEEERLEMLLKLAIPDPKKREVYRARFRTNSKLIEQDWAIDSALKERTSQKVIRYSDKNVIGKAIFTGKEPVDGEMMQDMDEWIMHDEFEMAQSRNDESNRDDNNY